MDTNSTFPRFHLGLRVTDLNESVQFYSKLFDMDPTKTRSDYAKFEVAKPSLNFTLNQAADTPSNRGTLSHFGIQLDNGDDLAQHKQRLEALGLPLRVEEQTSCCYALQDKFWVSDPDGNQIEFFLVLAQDDSDNMTLTPGGTARESCCA